MAAAKRLNSKPNCNLCCDLCDFIFHSKELVFLEQLRLAPKVPKHKQARDAKRIIEQARRTPLFEGGPYKTRIFSKEWRKAIIEKHSERHDDSLWKLVVAKEWRRLGVDNSRDGEKIEQCMHYACFKRFINIFNLHMRRF